MRFSTTAVLALPLLAAAAESPFEQYKAKFQNFLSSFGAGSPPAAADQAEPSAASTKAKAKVGPKKIEELTMQNWKETLYAPVQPEATVPEEWWVLLTGGNKTCFGRCANLDKAFNETAVKLATKSNTPHLARLNCDNEPVLCNSWMASAGSLWAFHMLPKPAPISAYWRSLNLSSVTVDTLVDLQAKPTEEEFRLIEGWFHPFNGPLADNNLAIPFGYLLWGLNAIPSWAMMLVISFFSRSFMNRGLGPDGGRAGAGGAGADAPPRAPARAAGPQ